MNLTYADPLQTVIRFELDAGEQLGNIQGPVQMGFVPKVPGNAEYDDIVRRQLPIKTYKQTGPQGTRGATP